MSRRWYAACGLVVLGAWVAGYMAVPGDDRDGQIVFIPMTNAPAGRLNPDLGAVTIWSCEATSGGLIVTGHVETPGEVQAVSVTPGDPQGVGRAVGSSFAVSSGVPPDAQLGDFSVTLSWATRDSGFAVASPETLTGSSLLRESGPSTTCPR